MSAALVTTDAMAVARSERALPYNLDAEASILGGLLLRNDLIERVGNLEVDDFYSMRHRVVFQAMRNLQARHDPIDAVTVELEIERAKKLDAIGGIAFLGELALRVPIPENVESYSEIVRRLAANRRGIIALSEALDRAYRCPFEPEEMLLEVAGELQRLDRLASKASALGRSWDDCVDEIYARKDEPWVDILISGVSVASCRNGSFVALVAPSGGGKSTLAIQMLIDHAVNRGPAVYLTYELDGDEAVARGIGQATGRGWAGVLKGETPRAMVPSVPRLRILERDDATLARLERVIEALRREYPDQPILVVSDYIQATPAPPGKERGYVAGISTDLRRAAKRYRVVIIGVSQASTVNSTKMRSGDLIGIDSSSTGAETSQIERDSYVILTLGDRRIVDPDTVAWKLSTAKYRMGESDMVYEAHYRGRIGTWEIVGEAKSAHEVRAARVTEESIKKVAELKRSIATLVAASPKPMSRAEISDLSTGKNDFKSTALRELVAEQVLVPVPGMKRGGHSLLWTPERLTKNGAQSS